MSAKTSALLLVFFGNMLSHTAKSDDNQYFLEPKREEYFTDADKVLDQFLSPIKFTRAGIKCWLRHTLSKEEYCQDFLPHNFCHLIEFLEFGKDSHQNLLYIQSTVRLFSNRVKRCAYISSDATSNLLDRLPNLIQGYFVKKPRSLFAEAKDTVKQLLYTSFLSKFEFFKQDPDSFFEELSGEILEELGSTAFVQNHIDKEQLRCSVIRFLELVLNKLVWSPLDQEEVWDSVKTISIKLSELTDYHVIGNDDLDDLYQSLIERFIFFLHLSGGDLSINVINTIKKDLDEKALLFLTLEEQEEYMETKADRLKEALLTVEAKVLAKQRGIVA